MEFGSGETPGEGEGEGDAIRKLFRDVLIQCLGHMEAVNLMDLLDARRFIRSPNFERVCDYAGWGDEWLRDLMTAVDRLPDGVRGAIVSDCVRMLKALSKLT